MSNIIQTPAAVEIVIKRSRFIARSFCITDAAQAQAILDDLRKQHWDATHNCYAYVCGQNGCRQKFSDDGEPGGTAGMPMLEVLRARDMTDVLVVVTRYFGGIQLGAGGLVRAYAGATAKVLDASGRLALEPGVFATLALSYDQYGKVDRLLRAGNCEQIQAQFTDSVAVTFWVRQGDLAMLRDRLTDALGGAPSLQCGKSTLRGWENEK